jgi:hypothetical protein
MSAYQAMKGPGQFYSLKERARAGALSNSSARRRSAGVAREQCAACLFAPQSAPHRAARTSAAGHSRRPEAISLSMRSRRSAASRGTWWARATSFFARNSFSLLASSARLRIVQTSSSAVDIAWMSCGPNTLSLGNGTMVMGVLTARAGKNESGSFVPEPPRAHPRSPAMRCTTRPRPSSHHQRSCIFAPFGSLDEPELGPNPYTRARN